MHQNGQRPGTLLLIVERVLNYGLRDLVLVVYTSVEHEQGYIAAVFLPYVVYKQGLPRPMRTIKHYYLSSLRHLHDGKSVVYLLNLNV